jgi:DNA repair protein RecN (Recombination protein N)
MLDELIVRNLGVIEEARIEVGPGLTVITGETGTGKTLLLGALRLLLGGVARTELVGPFGAEAVAEGRFVPADGVEIAAGRRLTSGGRSRAYLDGSIASAAALDGATTGLVEIIGQHDQLGLTRPSEVRHSIDRLLDEEGQAARADYARVWERFRRLVDAQERLGGDRHALERERDLVRFQATEISRSGFTGGEDVELETRLRRLRNLEALRTHLAAASSGLDAGRDGLGSAVAELRKASGLDPTLADVLSELDSLEDRMGDAALSIGRAVEDLEGSGGDLEEGEQRLAALNDLRRKYGPTLADVLEFGTQMRMRADELDTLLTQADSLDHDLSEARSELRAAGERLRTARVRAAKKLAATAVSHLRDLGFADPRVEADVAESDPGPSGADAARLLFASDSRLKPGEIGKVASGGELSRLVLALRLAGGAGDARTLVFDEIDAGVGGATALAVGQKLADLAATSQVLCVTHLPQVAAFADTHFVVERIESSARVRKVDGPSRLEELARMLAGLPDSERGREAAEELIELAQTRMR